MTTLNEQADPVPGMHRVRIIPPAEPRHAMLSMAYSLEIDGHPLYASRIALELEPDKTPVVTVSLPAIVENAEALALLRPKVIALDDEKQADTEDEAPDSDEPMFGCMEEC